MNNFPRKDRCRGIIFKSYGDKHRCNKIITRKHAGHTLCNNCRRLLKSKLKNYGTLYFQDYPVCLDEKYNDLWR
jgi:hypothetical protein